MEQQIHRLTSAIISENADTEMDQGTGSSLEWTPTAKMVLTKMVLTQAQSFGADIEAFAKYKLHDCMNSNVV